MNRYKTKQYYKLWDECLKGNSKPMSDALEGWTEEDKLNMFYHSFVGRYSKTKLNTWNDANTKYKYYLYYNIFQQVANKKKTLLGRLWLKLFKL